MLYKTPAFSPFLSQNYLLPLLSMSIRLKYVTQFYRKLIDITMLQCCMQVLLKLTFICISHLLDYLANDSETF